MARLYSGIILIALIFAGLGGCASSNSGTPALDESPIPETAYEIHLYSQKNPDDFLTHIRRRLESEGFNIGDYSSAKLTLWGVRPQIGRGLEMTVFASTENDPVTDLTVARISGILGDERGRCSLEFERRRSSIRI